MQFFKLEVLEERLSRACSQAQMGLQELQSHKSVLVRVGPCELVKKTVLLSLGDCALLVGARRAGLVVYSLGKS